MTAQMTDWTDPGTGDNDGVLIAGDDAWTNPENITANDGSYAVSDTPHATFEISSGIVAYNFGFNLPTDDSASVTGIAVRVKGYNYATNGSTILEFLTVTLCEDLGITGMMIGDNKASEGGAFPDSDTGYFATFGGQSDLWGVGSITPADVNDSGFGVGIGTYKTGTGGSDPQPAIDSVQIRIYYEADTSVYVPQLHTNVMIDEDFRA